MFFCANAALAQVDAPPSLVGVWKVESPEAIGALHPAAEVPTPDDRLKRRILIAKAGRFRVQVRSDGRVVFKDRQTVVPGRGQIVQHDPLRVKVDIGVAEQVLSVKRLDDDRIEVDDGALRVMLIRHKPVERSVALRLERPPALTGAALGMVGTWAAEPPALTRQQSESENSDLREAHAQARKMRIEISPASWMHFYAVNRAAVVSANFFIESQTDTGFVVKARMVKGKMTRVETLNVSLEGGRLILDNPRGGRMAYRRTHPEPIGQGQTRLGQP